jgi:hypothetical protein
VKGTGGGTAGRKLGDSPANTPAGDPAKAAYTPTGTLVADTGFRPEKDGFGIPNYGATLGDGTTAVNMNAADMRAQFGDGVCADLTAGKCDLVPPAQSYMDQTNAAMGGGHCYGFAVASTILWKKTIDAATYGAATSPLLPVSGNTPLQRVIATAWAQQALVSVRTAVVKGAPNDILDKLISDLKPNPSETYTIAIFKRDGTGGHAVTPFAVEDLGNGKMNVLIYDNNYPGITRAVQFDRTANTWKYNAATNPNEPSELYEGDATTQSISLYPLNPGMGLQACPFCAKVPTGAATAALGGSTAQASLAGFRQDAGTAAPMDEIYLDASTTDHGHLLITDPQGHRLGYVDGKIVNEIPGARVDKTLSDETWKDAPEPTYYVPDGQAYTITVDGAGMTAEDDIAVGVIGPSFDLSVDTLQLHPGEKDVLTFTTDATKVSFKADQPQTPSIKLGVSDTSADYEFGVAGVKVAAGSTTDLALAAEGADLIVSTSGPGGSNTYALSVKRENDQGVQLFKNDGVDLTAGDTADLQFGQPTDPTAPVPLVTTHNGQTTTVNLAEQAP